jgi:hypothetical protein
MTDRFEEEPVPELKSCDDLVEDPEAEGIRVMTEEFGSRTRGTSSTNHRPTTDILGAMQAD